MQASQNAVELIKEFEGCRLKAYRDQRGVWTCGYGQTGPSIKPYTHWTEAQAEAALKDALVTRSKQLSTLLEGCETNQNQFDAMLSLSYNIGMGAFHTSEVYRDHKAGEFTKAAAAFMNWDNLNHHENAGLHRRRLAEKALYERH
jgi:lysozyme